jgi:serine phosphatase RsbU (regulator of sigma subunit)/anti-sigma regulatory factor (Ser/Thr protein kinase)
MVPVPVRRRLRLPADYRSPAAARAAVRDVLAASGHTDLLDEALLLTTELSTNGVIHAGTDLDVEIVADRTGVTVTVIDYRGGPIEVPDGPPDQLSEHGRGLLLVDQFATSWGTTHDPTGKGVWFRLERGSPPARNRAGQPTRPRPDTPEVLPSGPADALVWLVHVPDDLRQRLSLQQLVAELLLRLCEVTGAAGGAVLLDRADGHGERAFARHGTAGRPALTVELPLPRPMSGRITLVAAPLSPVDGWSSLAQLSAERIAIAVESDRLHEADAQRQGWLTYLAEAGELLAQSLDVRLTLALVPQLVVPRLGEWCAVHTRDEYGDLRLATLVHADEAARPVLRRLLSGGGGPELPERLAESLSAQAMVVLPRPVEGIAVPLTARGTVLGTLSVGRPAGRMHAPDDVAVVSDLARRASLALENARIHAERDAISQAFQRALLPAALPTRAGIQFAAEYEPVSTGSDVGGDFYDVLELGPEQWLMCIGDVCGKGARAAALTGLVRDVIRVLIRDGRTPDRVVELLNRTLLDQDEIGRYCTLAMAVVTRAADGGLDVELCLSGHDRPVLLPTGGEPRQVGEHGTAVGLLEDVAVTPVKLRLDAGDSLVFFTDGVTERRRGRDLFGRHRLVRELRRLTRQSPVTAASLAAGVRAAALDFSPDAPRDDIAVLVLRNE